MLLHQRGVQLPDFVAGVPDGATKLGLTIASIVGVEAAEMKKDDGKIILTSELFGGATLLLIEDFCTRGTGFAEAVSHIASQQPSVTVLPYDPVIINRGGLEIISVPGVGVFNILPVVDKRVQDWDLKDCPLCKAGSEPIKPKVNDENWELLINSQLE